MSWNPNKPPLEINKVNNDARRAELGHIVPNLTPIALEETIQPIPASNFAPNIVQETKEHHEKNATINRARELNRADDNVVDTSVGLLDIDTAILGYMQNKLNIEIVDNGKVLPVPIIMGSPERWKAALKDGYLRDKKGQLQNPLIMIRRSSFSRNDQLMTFNRHVSETYVRKYTPKNMYDKFSLIADMVPTHEIFNVTCPHQILVTYDCAIWTDLNEQMNTIIERINFAVEEYWGDKNSFRFRVRISNWSTPVEVPVDDDRLVRSDCSFEVWAYLLPKTFETYKSTTQKSLSLRKLVFGAEVSVTGQDIINSFPKIQKFENTNIDNANLKASLFVYQGIQKTVYGNFVSITGSETVIVFPNTSLLPTPQVLVGAILDINKFTIFVDGTSISKLSIASFAQTGNDFTVTLVNLPMEITHASEIFSMGKFS